MKVVEDYTAIIEGKEINFGLQINVFKEGKKGTLVHYGIHYDTPSGVQEEWIIDNIKGEQVKQQVIQSAANLVHTST